MQCRLHDLVRFAESHILWRVQDVGVGFAHHLVRFIAIHSPRPLVPEKYLAIQILADDGVFGRSL